MYLSEIIKKLEQGSYDETCKMFVVKVKHGISLGLQGCIYCDS